MTDIARRTLTAGAVWSIPAITVASAAPAVGASGIQPSIQRQFYLTRTSPDGTTGTLTVESNNDAQSYYRVVNVNPKTTVANVRASVLVTVPNLRFTTSTRNWGPVTQDTQTYTYDGTVYYRYYATLAVPVPAAVNGVITIPPLRWTSAATPALVRPVTANGRGTIALNGPDVVATGGFRTI